MLPGKLYRFDHQKVIYSKDFNLAIEILDEKEDFIVLCVEHGRSYREWMVKILISKGKIGYYRHKDGESYSNPEMVSPISCRKFEI